VEGWGCRVSKIAPSARQIPDMPSPFCRECLSLSLAYLEGDRSQCFCANPRKSLSKSLNMSWYEGPILDMSIRFIIDQIKHARRTHLACIMYILTVLGKN